MRRCSRGSYASSRTRKPRKRRSSGSPTRCRAYLCPLSRSEEHTSELQSRRELVCRLLLEKKKKKKESRQVKAKKTHNPISKAKRQGEHRLRRHTTSDDTPTATTHAP